MVPMANAAEMFGTRSAADILPLRDSLADRDIDGIQMSISGGIVLAINHMSDDDDIAVSSHSAGVRNITAR